MTADWTQVNGITDGNEALTGKPAPPVKRMEHTLTTTKYTQGTLKQTNTGGAVTDRKSVV